MLTPNPNRTPFPRAVFLESFLNRGALGRIHPLERARMEPSIRERDPLNWRHTLGAFDVILDNLGLLVGEQFNTKAESVECFGAAQMHLELYDHATRLLQPVRPWEGDYLLGNARRANAGEPRPFLRLLAEAPLDWASQLLTDDASISARSCAPLNPLNRFKDLPWHLLLPDGWVEDEEFARTSPIQVLGVPLPPDFSPTVPPSRLLPPKEATPDLPLRVGMSPTELAEYRLVIRNQGGHPTCTAHALAMGLALAARRTRRGRNCRGFSASWIHYASAQQGQSWNQGRRLKNAVEAVLDGLPCPEDDFPYPAPDAGPRWATPARTAAADDTTAQMGPLEVLKLDPSQVSRIKTLLAAGWLVVVTTFFPKSWWARAFNNFGLPMLPLPGEPRENAGHAWLLVGYDHVDGQPQWKYQGRFIALNSWGSEWPPNPLLPPGLCSLPFSFFLTEGLEAYALRFPETAGSKTTARADRTLGESAIRLAPPLT